MGTAIGIGIKTTMIPSSGAAAGSRYFITQIGESNSGGVASNSGIATTAHSEVKLLDNTGLASFDSLAIGVNNLVGHTGLSANATHGWEYGLYQRIAANGFAPHSSSKPVYLLKAGQGGSTFAEWGVGDASGYLATFATRWAAALALLPAEVTAKAVWTTIGINNLAAGAYNPTFSVIKSGIDSCIAAWRTVIGADTPIFMARLMPPFQWGNFLYEEYARHNANFYVVDSDNANLNVDNLHWNSPSMETNAAALVAATLSPPATPPLATCSPVAWTTLTAATSSGGQITSTGGAGGGGTATTTVDAASAFRVEIDWPSAVLSQAVVVTLDTVQNRGADNYAFTAANDYVYGVYEFSGQINFSLIGGSASGLSTPSYPCKIAIQAVGLDLLLCQSTDAGATWTTISRHKDLLSGLGTLYIKAMFVVPSAGQNVTVKVG